jgi:hypothetical protein
LAAAGIGAADAAAERLDAGESAARPLGEPAAGAPLQKTLAQAEPRAANLAARRLDPEPSPPTSSFSAFLACS